MTDETMRDHRDRLIKEAQQKQDQWRQENRGRHNQIKALHDDLSDAYKDYEHAKREQNFLGMSKAQERIDSLKKQIDEMNPAP